MRVIICQLKPFLSNDKTLELFLQQNFEKLYITYPSDHFTQITANGINKHQNTANASVYQLRVPMYASMWKNLWIKSAVKKIILKSGAAVVLSINAAMQKKIPECVFISDIDFDVTSLKNQQSNIIAPSLYVCNYLVQKGISEQQITVLRPWCATSFQPVEWEIREQTKEVYANGNEYILVDASLLENNQIVQILKSFSLFKKWQKTSAQILFTSMSAVHADAEKMLQHYKYKADVKIIPEETYRKQQPTILASAWALLHFPLSDNSGVALMEAMQTETPVITHKLGAIEETIGEGATYCSLDAVEPLAEAMINLYKNEKLRNANIQTAKAMLKTSAATGIAELWHILNVARATS